MTSKSSSTTKAPPLASVANAKNRLIETQAILEKAHEIALFYGFETTILPSIEPSLFAREKKSHYSLSLGRQKDYQFTTDATLSLLSMKTASVDPKNPLYTFSLLPKISIEDGVIASSFDIRFDIHNSAKPVSDAIVIGTTMKLLDAIKVKNVTLKIGTVGDKDSKVAHEKEIKSFLKKSLSKMDPKDKDLYKVSPLSILFSEHEKTKEVLKHLPDTMNTLSPQAKSFFKNLIEYLEETQIAYEFNPTFTFGDPLVYHTVFEVVHNETLQVLARGYRYGEGLKQYGITKELPSIGVQIFIDTIIMQPDWGEVKSRIAPQAKFYFIQCGIDAKLKSLPILEELRTSNISVLQSITEDSLSKQLEAVEKNEIPYVLIFGQKEAIDGTVLVRTMKTRAQVAVKIKELVKHLKGLK
ncbi:MAG TPA: His/Gly/Thr/Pro-type tRNA ligase C-terminal domain-containing protein [Candidatus Paceibacterota bacterium]